MRKTPLACHCCRLEWGFAAGIHKQEHHAQSQRDKQPQQHRQKEKAHMPPSLTTRARKQNFLNSVSGSSHNRFLRHKPADRCRWDQAIFDERAACAAVAVHPEIGQNGVEFVISPCKVIGPLPL
jgi:hypothetical protein